MSNVISIAKRKDDINGVADFEVAGSDLYPTMIKEIKEALASGKAPAKFLDTDGTPNPLRTYWGEAQAIGASNLDLALVPFKEAVSLQTAQKQSRNTALECARKWFTELLHQSVKFQPMRLHITTDENRTFRLT
ncbi:MAG: hypothetical protein JXA73_08820 [Acidobacteria bacterium]|nr:hypothetical protein [Acidobacteriota bacterium]